jgi:adsorption protein B
MGIGSGWALVEWLLLIERELLVFALFWFSIGLIDELGVDIVWFALRTRSEFATPRLAADTRDHPMIGRLAVFVAAWREAEVIGGTVAGMLEHWRGRDYVLYVGCYGNDPGTIQAVVNAAGHDPRLRLVIHDRPGPTTKADCLNRVFAAMAADEERFGERFSGVILHDSEDMVHPLELLLVDHALADFDFVQLPVRPEIPEGMHWVAGHYCDEFADTHARLLVVRDALGAGLPAAGVSCGFGRDILDKIGDLRREEGVPGPFASECFTEDYELGMLIKRMGGRSRFLRCRDHEGQLIGTRSYFPDTLISAVRQKTRWMHGISLQGWDRLGWGNRWVDNWMVLRDRRGPMNAVVLLAGYALVVVELVLMLAQWHYGAAMPKLAGDVSYLRRWIFSCGAGAAWRMVMRFVMTAREYGPLEGLLAVFRVPLANVILIMAGRRALFSYCRGLAGAKLVWDKTEHHAHPVKPKVAQ